MPVWGRAGWRLVNGLIWHLPAASQAPRTGTGLMGGSAATGAARAFHSDRPGARSRRDTKRSDWHQRVQPGRATVNDAGIERSFG